MHLHAVEARRPSPGRGCGKQLRNRLNLLQRHSPWLLWFARHGDARRTHGCGSDDLVGAAPASVGDLDHGRSTTLMDGVGYAGEAGDVFVAPDTELVDVHATSVSYTHLRAHETK